MQFLLFDVKPFANAVDQYLSIAAALRPELDASGGCEFIDRFRRLGAAGYDSNWVLSFQIWRDEESLVKWRNNAIHHNAQESGRESVFEDYRLRVGRVMRSYTRGQSVMRLSEAPENSQLVVIVETNTRDYDLSALNEPLKFESIYRPGEHLHVGQSPSHNTVYDAFDLAVQDRRVSHAAMGCVERTYGMYQRAEAPQYFPER